MPRVSRTSPPLRRAPRSRDAMKKERMMNADEKRGLILAHASARTSRPSRGGFVYSIGILASCLVVFTGWWLTLGTNLRTSLSLARPSEQLVDSVRESLPLPATTPEQDQALRTAAAMLKALVATSSTSVQK